MLTRRSALAAAAGALTAGCATTRFPVVMKPLIIAHRGASGDRVEHTQSAYQLAVEQGADFIEPDLVITKDGVLVCRHEPELSNTTDIAARPAFADRKTSKTISGERQTGWFVEDFTLEEVKTLRCRESRPDLRPANTAFDGREPILTFDEVVALAKAAGVGVYPEMKLSRHFSAAGLSLPRALAAALDRAGWTRPEAPVFVQSFEPEALVTMMEVSGVRRVQLIPPTPDYAAMTTPEGLARVAGYAQGIGAEKGLVIARTPEGRMGTQTALIKDARAAGLFTHAWTFRAENFFLPLEARRGDPAALDHARRRGDLSVELVPYFAAGVEGVFTDHPALTVAALG